MATDKETSTEISNETVKNAKSYSEYLEKSAKYAEKNKDAFGKIGDFFKDMRGKLNDMANCFGAANILAGLDKLVEDAADLDKYTTHLSVQMGKMGPSVSDLKKATTGLMTEFGVTYEAAKNTVETLGKKAYVGNIKEAARASAMFAKATGDSFENTAELTDALSKFGKLGETQIKAVYANMTKIQHTYGMSAEAMRALNSHIKTSAENMRLLGKTGSDIEKLAAQSAKLVSAMEKVGVAAETALGWVDKLTDPTRIEENIPLYTQMGISIQDALTGNINPDAITNGMKDIGQRLKSMGAIAGSQYAQQLGISYKDAIKAADVNPIQDSDQVKEEDSDAVLKKASESMESMTEKLEKLGNQLKGWLMKINPIILGIFNFLTKRTEIFKKGFLKDSKEVAASIKTEAESTIGAIEQSLNKTKSRMDANRKATGSIGVKMFFGTKEEMDKSIQTVTELVDNLSKKNLNKLKKYEKEAMGSFIDQMKTKKRLTLQAEQEEYNMKAQNRVLESITKDELLKKEINDRIEASKMASDAEKTLLNEQISLLETEREKLNELIEMDVSGMDAEGAAKLVEALDSQLTKQQAIVETLKEKQNIERESLENIINQLAVQEEIINNEQATVFEKTVAIEKTKSLLNAQQDLVKQQKNTNKELKKAVVETKKIKNNLIGAAKAAKNAAINAKGIKAGGSVDLGGAGAGGGGLGKLGGVFNKMGGGIGKLAKFFTGGGLMSTLMNEFIPEVMNKVGPWGILIALAIKALMPMLEKFVIPILKELMGSVMQILRLFLMPLFMLIKYTICKPVEWINKGIQKMLKWLYDTFPGLKKYLDCENEENEEDSEGDSNKGPSMVTISTDKVGNTTFNGGNKVTAGGKQVDKETKNETDKIKQEKEKAEENTRKDEQEKMMKNQEELTFSIQDMMKKSYGNSVTGFGREALNVNIVAYDGLDLGTNLLSRFVGKQSGKQE